MVDQDRIKCFCNQSEMTFKQKLVLYPLMLKKDLSSAKVFFWLSNSADFHSGRTNTSLLM